MGNLLSFIDIIIVVMLTVFLFLNLRRLLGQRVGYSGEGRNVGKPNKEEESVKEKKLEIPSDDLDEHPVGSLSYKVNSLSKIDTSFSRRKFIESAKKAFQLIVTGYTSGNLESIKPFVSKEIYDSFKAHIDNNFNYAASSKILDFLMSEIYDISIQSNTARIKVKFITKQQYVDSGKFNKSTTKEIHEFWTFAKVINKEISIWELVRVEKIKND